MLMKATAFAAWLTASTASVYIVMAYDFIPGRIDPHHAHWPADSGLARSANRTTALVFLHPRCACSKASVAHLIRIWKLQPDAELIAAVFVPRKPEDNQKAWEDAESVRMLRAGLSQARLVYDVDGQEARRFGAYTSGTVLVYDQSGGEVFRGGITDRRGGERDNSSLRQLQVVLGQLADSAGQKRPTPVFGCPIIATESTAQRSGT